jgi:hypothetical protein
VDLLSYLGGTLHRYCFMMFILQYLTLLDRAQHKMNGLIVMFLIPRRICITLSIVLSSYFDRTPLLIPLCSYLMVRPCDALYMN